MEDKLAERIDEVLDWLRLRCEYLPSCCLNQITFEFDAPHDRSLLTAYLVKCDPHRDDVADDGEIPLDD